MENTISVSYPKELAFTLKMQEDEFKKEIQKITVVKLYEIGKISSSLASKILKLNRIDFLKIINKYQVPLFSHKSGNNLLNDLQNA